MSKIHQDIRDEIVDLYEQGMDIEDIFDYFEERVTDETIWEVISEYEASDIDFDMDHDDMFDVDSALGSAGWGTDEYYEGF